jgi:hypothetical protein
MLGLLGIGAFMMLKKIQKQSYSLVGSMNIFLILRIRKNNFSKTNKIQKIHDPGEGQDRFL